MMTMIKTALKRFDFDAVEQTLLLELLYEELGGLREQVFHAQTSREKDTLRRREAVVRSVILKLGGSQD